MKSYTKKFISVISLLILFLSTPLINSCSNSDDLYDEMPREIQSFLAQYYPNSQLFSFSFTDKSYTVIIKNGPTIIFDSKCNWTSINGNGSTIPQVLLFNDFPPVLYNYLQETEETNDVFSVTRNATHYVVELMDTTITYDINSGTITGTEPPK